ncbi:sigma factor-like helix-turn-helix DNA-binding protein [Vallitalea guaymasensis]|uniref:sigma factor-like helix-turn-helix DNA-binding protein n=1 Tax=Vallitalea guaymasensis TaxID=1185412 RepID=UPI000DE27E53|nr:sigma factor-like helix-turn-helix DNA-binding protein [Vallitalea guaymasensis]
MEENYYALMLSILYKYTPDQAFDILEYGRIKRRRDENKKDALEMVHFKSQGLTYKEIGEMYGITADAVYTRIRRALSKI